MLFRGTHRRTRPLARPQVQINHRVNLTEQIEDKQQARSTVATCPRIIGRIPSADELAKIAAIIAETPRGTTFSAFLQDMGKCGYIELLDAIMQVYVEHSSVNTELWKRWGPVNRGLDIRRTAPMTMADSTKFSRFLTEIYEIMVVEYQRQRSVDCV